MTLHGGLIAVRSRGRWLGVLIQGPSGCGKSDLALRALEHGFRLVADDRVILFSVAGRLFGRAPKPLEELLEIRGVTIGRVNALRFAEIALLATCEGDVERLPPVKHEFILGVALPTLSLAPLEPSAPAKLCRALEVLGTGAQQDYDAAFQRIAPRALV